MYRRISNIQTGCPHNITHAFVVESEYEEEVAGLEKLLHRLLPSRLRGEWYKGTDTFFEALDTLVKKTNSGSSSYEEIDQLPDLNAGPELEIMMHRHNFNFMQICLPINKHIPITKAAKKIEPEDIVQQLRIQLVSV